MKSQKQQIDQAIKVLQQGGVIGYPTEAVYGLGCDANNITAVNKILNLKQRNKAKGLILVAAHLDQFKDFIQPLEKHTEEKLLASWKDKGTAKTWLVPAKTEVSDYLKGQYDTIAIRVSHHAIVKELCEKFSGAIVSTSANIATQEAARTAEEVKLIFGDKIDFIVEGETDINALPSTIRNALTDEIIR